MFCTIAILQANGIAPYEKSNKRKASTPLEEPSEDEADKAARAAEIEALEVRSEPISYARLDRFHLSQARLRDLKGHQSKRVKTEVKTEPLSILHPTKNLGVIDLTDLD